MKFKDIQGTIIIDLNKSIEELKNNLNRQMRKAINISERNGLLFYECDKEEDKEYWYKEIYYILWSSKGLVPEDKNKLFKQNQKLFLVEYENLIVAGGLVDGIDTDKINFVAFAYDSEFKIYRPNEYLYWRVILYAKENDYKKVDLGGWQIKPRGNQIGINIFKEKWGGEVVIYNIYSDNPLYIIGRKLIRNFSFFWWLNKKIKGRK